MIILYFLLIFLFGVSIGAYLQKRLTTRMINIEHDKMNLNKENDYAETILNVKNGNSEFKTRVNDTVYVGVNLEKWGDCDIIYMMDKHDIAIFQGTKCIHTSDGVSKEIIDELISVILNIYNKKINDIVEIFGFVFYREEFERSFNTKIEEIKNHPIFGNMKQDLNEIEKINQENKRRFDIDDILDKISKLGISSLTSDEKIFLDNYSNEKRN